MKVLGKSRIDVSEDRIAEEIRVTLRNAPNQPGGLKYKKVIFDYNFVISVILYYESPSKGKYKNRPKSDSCYCTST